MRLVVASFVLAATLPVLHAQGIGAVAVGIPSGNAGVSQLHQTNNPFTLVLERKTVQTLPDGTHITRIEHDTLLRDTLGRTRSEHTTEAFGAGHLLDVVTVDDIVSGHLFNWAEASGAMPREYSVRDTHSFPAASQMHSVPAGQTTTVAQTSNQYHVVQDIQAPRKMPRPHVEELGMKDIQGASCKLTRTTMVYPEGFFGNDRPITETDERCYSQEFDRELEGTRVDPRSGTTTTTVVSLNRGEPDATLFHPPADYRERPQAQPSR